MTNEKIQINTKFILGFFVLASLITLATRWIPHEPNFSALGGFLFLGGFLGFRKTFFLPLAFAIVMISDMVLGTYPGIELVYVAYLLILGLGYLSAAIGQRFSTLALSSTVAAIFFFVLSNLGVYFASGLYPQTSEGLRECFIMALPFFRNTLAAQLIFGLGFVYAFRIASQKLAIAKEVKA